MSARELASVPVPTKGSGPVECSEPQCHGHRARCLFGRSHVWLTWYEGGELARTEDTYRCLHCDGVCTGEELEPAPAVIRPAVLPVRVVAEAAFTAYVVAPSGRVGEKVDPWDLEGRSLAAHRLELAAAARTRRPRKLVRL